MRGVAEWAACLLHDALLWAMGYGDSEGDDFRE